jgi:ketosteroid isomerase-like protein
MDEALALVAPNAKFISTRPQPNPHNALHGTFIGPEGAKQLFTLFGTLLEPQAFNIEGRFSQGEHAAFYGNFCHINRKTGKEFSSDWALICQIQAGKITLYHMYEDTEAMQESNS